MAGKEFQQDYGVLPGLARRLLMVLLLTALNSATWLQPASAQIVVFEDNGNLPVPATEEEKATYRRRLAAVTDASRTWLMTMSHGDEDQQDRAVKLCQEQLDQALERRLRQDTVLTLHDTSPGLFASKDTRNWGFLNGNCSLIFDKALTPAQRDFTRADDTQPYHRRQVAYRNYALATLDSQLYFSPEQREAWLQASEISASNYFRGFFAWHGDGFLNREAIGAAPTMVPPANQPARAALVAFLAQRDFYSRIAFPQDLSKYDEVQFEKSFAPERRRLRDAYLAMAQVRIHWYAAEHRISEQQQQLLLTAAKGWTSGVLNDVRARQWAYLEQARADAAPYAKISRIPVPSTQEFTADPRWNATLKEVFPEIDPELERKVRIRNATTAAMVAMLDEELWLLPEQWTALLPLVEATLPLEIDQLVGPGEAYEIVNLARILSGVDAGQLAQLLNWPQQRVWKEMSAAMGFHHVDGELYAQIIARPSTSRSVLIKLAAEVRMPERENSPEDSTLNGKESTPLKP